ncbi:MAG TPA: methyltransferase domain-containing protein [Haliangiales bacterium]|nr:methyltransferase domain-containing protein [Haliangiales bacterium]
MRAVSLAFALALAACGASTPPPPAPAPTAPPAPIASTDHVADHVHHRFDDVERWVRVFDDPDRDAWQRPAEVVAILRVAPGMTVADLGAGTGYFLPHLSPAVGPTGRVLALDVEPAMVRYMRDRAARQGLTNVVASAVPPDDPRLPRAGVDRVLIVDTWHHLPDRAAYSAKLAAGLKPGGMVVVVDFTKESRLGPPPAARVAPEDVVAELRAGGLDAEIVTETLSEQYVVIGRRR